MLCFLSELFSCIVSFHLYQASSLSKVLSKVSENLGKSQECDLPTPPLGVYWILRLRSPQRLLIGSCAGEREERLELFLLFENGIISDSQGWERGY